LETALTTAPFSRRTNYQTTSFLVVFLFAEKLTGFYLPAGGRTQYYIKAVA